jgi:hypothetical protein
MVAVVKFEAPAWRVILRVLGYVLAAVAIAALWLGIPILVAMRSQGPI